MKKILKDSLILCLITLVSGILLGSVFEITKDGRAQQEVKTRQEAYKKVFEDADSFEEIEYDENAMKSYLKENGYSDKVATIDEVVKANNSSKEMIGYVITVTDKEGYGGDITFTFGIQNNGTINGISFLVLNETAGVGMKVGQNSFKSQFEGKNVDSFKFVKSGKSAENEIDAIGGATVSTKAVTDGVNAGILSFKFLSEENGGLTNE